VTGAPVRIARALALSCPECGGRPVLERWLKLHERCPRCRLRLERGESGYAVGALALNLVTLELLFIGAFVVIAWRTWPDPPWAWLEYGSAIVLAVGGFVFYPFAKLVWLALDLSVRPVRPEDRA